MALHMLAGATVASHRPGLRLCAEASSALMRCGSAAGWQSGLTLNCKKAHVGGELVDNHQPVG